MKSILLIGLGRFGLQLAKSLSKYDYDMLAVDCDEDKINEALPYVPNAEIGHITSEAYIKSLGVGNFDVCIVAVGNSFQVSLEATALLKEAGARRIISRADSDAHAKLLTLVGADEIIYPEKDMAVRLAVKLGSNAIVDYFKITSSYSVFEIPVPHKWEGRSIGEIGVRAKYKVSILAVKEKDSDELKPMPGANYVFSEEENLLVLGQNDDVSKLITHM
ncbi:MAG: Ktr system potassium uptake protein A [Firmicutes bacterium ADurb.Bin300]|jgi:trk system potassium uptake protein TrkA|nr:MAG: Ktr system potassium uptake protein A [Firmicutes bacterium ADurb.Bin300]HOD02871.1 TrkA family potassium uptake protein [Clostridiales bacterium]